MKTALVVILALPLAAQLKDSGARYSPYDLMYYGAECDGSTNDTTALNNAIAFVVTAGGTLTIPQGKTCLISGQVAIPNNGASPKPLQKGLRITGSGGGADSFGNGGSTSSGGSTLDLRYSSVSTTDGKIITLGVGKLELDHLTLTDGGADSGTPFLYTTNTTLLVHHNTIIGNAAGQDFVVFGGPTSVTLGNTAAAPFQGYGTVIDSNFADKIARFAYFRNYANGIQVVNNTIWNRSAGTAPFELVGTNGGGPEGNYIAGNLLELGGYTYAAVLNAATRNTFVANTLWDRGLSFDSYFNCTSSTQNVFGIGHTAGVSYTKYTSGDTGSNNLIVGLSGSSFVGTGAGCVDTNTDIGKIWFDTTTTTTALKVCMYVSGTLGWVTK